jgi:hypothetical protein
MLAACRRRNSVQLVSRRFWSRLDPRLLEDRPDGARRQLDSEPEQFALDPPVAPARILPGQANHQLTHLVLRRRATGTPVRIRPTARDELTMPTQQRPKRHEQRPLPDVPWQYAAERSQQRPVSRRQLRTSDLALQHP